jgi:hypothetical protein
MFRGCDEMQIGGMGGVSVALLAMLAASYELERTDPNAEVID